MSPSTVGFDRAAVDARLAEAITPEEVVATLATWIEENAAEPPRGVYLADHRGVLHLERRFAFDPSCPHRIDADTDAGPTLVRFPFRDRLLGAVLVPAVVDGLEEFLGERFAPALFRSLYLDDALREKQGMREQLFYLDEIGKLLGQLDLDLLLVNVLELTAAHLGADIGSITLQRPEGLVTAVDWGLPHEALAGLTLADGTPLVDRVASSTGPLLFDGDDLALGDARTEGLDRLLVLPLCTNDAFWGSINLVAPARVDDVEAKVLESIRSGVGLAATAIENALLLEIKLSREREQEQLKLGHQIQSALLPASAPETEGLDVAGSSVSATMIGGDYFDYYELPDGRLGLVVADVSGKGVPAGLIMTATRALFRATTARLSDPPRILEEVNRLLCAEGFGARFVTAAFLAMDAETGVFDYSTAGHDPPLLWRAAAGTVESEAVPALPLGLRPGATYDCRTVQLHGGDAVVVYTDGVSEAMDAGRDQFGEERLHEVLRKGVDDTASALRDRILRTIDAHCGSTPRHDDTTMIVVRRTAVTTKSESPSERAER